MLHLDETNLLLSLDDQVDRSKTKWSEAFEAFVIERLVKKGDNIEELNSEISYNGIVFLYLLMVLDSCNVPFPPKNQQITQGSIQ